MKKNQFILKLSVFAFLLLFSHVNSAGETAIFSKKVNQIPVVDFFKTDSVVVILPDQSTLNDFEKMDLENAIFWENCQLRPVYVYKTESEVNNRDLNKHMLFYGCLQQFNRKEFFSIPVKKDKQGFRFQNKRFEEPTDAFFYVNNKANRMYLLKNAENTRHQFFTMGGTAYPMHIFSEDKIVVTGIL